MRPNAGAARTGTITIGSQSFTVTQASATALSGIFNQLGYSVIGADYSKALDRLIIAVKSPKELHIYDPVGGSDQVVPLPKTPLFLSVSPDGLSAAIGADGWISFVNLSTATVTSTMQVFANVQTLLLAGNGYVYAFGSNGGSGFLSVQTMTGTLTLAQSYYNGRYPRLYADGSSFYTESSKYNISAGLPQPIQENYSGCAPFWLTEDGARMITSCGRVYTTSPVPSLDLQFNGSFSNISSNWYGTVIQWAAESAKLHSTAVIPSISPYSGQGTGVEDTSVQVYGDAALDYSGDLALPEFTVASTSYPGRGRYAFWNSSEDKLIVLEQADASANLLADYGAAVFSMATPGAGCTFTLGAPSGSLAAGEGLSTVSVATNAGCIWQAVSNASWITLASGGAGFGPGTLTYSIAPNAGAVARTGTITIAGQTFTVTQANSSSTGAAASFLVTAPASSASGVRISLTVSALDASGLPLPGYAGQIHFSSTDSGAILPADTILNGTGTFFVSLVTSGAQTITVSDAVTLSLTGTTRTIAVAAILPSRYVPITPCRVVDTRNPAGSFGAPFITAGGTRTFDIPSSSDCAIPAAATAYSLNLTVVPHTATLGYVTMWPAGGSQPLTSTLNSLDGRVKANAAIVPAGSGGAISVYATDDTDVILDISGYFVPPQFPAGFAFFPLPPCRLVDTRPNAPSTISSGSLAGGTSRTLNLLSGSCSVPVQAAAYSLNITSVPSGSLGYLTVSPTGGSRPLASTLNSPTGTVVANAAIVPAGANGSIDVYATDTTDLVVDINGYFAPAYGGLYLYVLPPCRVLDTRNSSGSQPFSGQLDVNVVASGCGGTNSAQAWVFNATVVPSASLGYLTLWPQGNPEPLVSTENSVDGALDSNMAIVPATVSGISAFASDSTQLILDTSGYFAP